MGIRIKLSQDAKSLHKKVEAWLAGYAAMSSAILANWNSIPSDLVADLPSWAHKVAAWSAIAAASGIIAKMGVSVSKT